jgi:hypothetical protein
VLAAGPLSKPSTGAPCVVRNYGQAIGMADLKSGKDPCPTRWSLNPEAGRMSRVTFSVDEAARAMGMRPAALRRLIERHAASEGDEIVARLSAGVVARKRHGFARWTVVIPPDLRD